MAEEKGRNNDFHNCKAKFFRYLVIQKKTVILSENLSVTIARNLAMHKKITRLKGNQLQLSTKNKVTKFILCLPINYRATKSCGSLVVVVVITRLGTNVLPLTWTIQWIRNFK